MSRITARALKANVTTTMTYRATGCVAAGGQGRLEAHGLVTPFDGTAARVETLPGPADLLCAALCACMLKNVQRFSILLPFRYESASIEVSADREEPPPRIARLLYVLRVVTDEAASRVELLHGNILKYGTITNTLATACELNGRIEAIKPLGQNAVLAPASR